MAFFLHPKQTYRSGRRANMVARITLRRRKTTTTEFTINGPLLQQLGWAMKATVSVLVGAGADHGRVLLVPGNHGYTLFPVGASKTIAQINVRNLFPGDDISATECAFEVNGNQLAVTIPAEFLPAQTVAA